MKETEQKNQDTIEIVNEAKKDIQKVLVGRVIPKKNHRVFEVDLNKKTIVEAKFESKATISFEDAQSGKKENRSIAVKKECLYIPALNKKNVLKILKRNYNIDLC